MDEETPQENLFTYLHALGMEDDDVQTYMTLVTSGASSALSIAKKTGISRTQVYRCLEKLKEHSLVSAEKLSYGTIFRTLPLQNIEGELASRDAETARLRDGLSSALHAMQEIIGANKVPTAEVQHYYGLAGMKQVNWNLLRAEKEYFVFELAHLTDHFETTFGRRHRERAMERGLISHDLTNVTVMTKAELEPFNPAKTFVRYIDPKILTINFEVYIYNDVVTLLDYKAKHPHAIEIHHPAFNAMMLQIYKALWSMATPLKLT